MNYYKFPILILNAFADYKCGEFHLTPVLTLAWPQDYKGIESTKWAYCIAIEWGFWAAWIGLAQGKKLTKDSTTKQ